MVLWLILAIYAYVYQLTTLFWNINNNNRHILLILTIKPYSLYINITAILLIKITGFMAYLTFKTYMVYI